MEPLVNFGEPTVEGTGYRALTLSRAIDLEGSVEAAAKAYEVPENIILLAREAVASSPQLQAA